MLSGDSMLGLPPGLIDSLAAQEETEETPQNRDHDQAADELGERERPAEQQHHDDPQLNHEIRRRAPLRKMSARARWPRRNRTTMPRRGRTRSRASAASRRAGAGSSAASTRPPGPRRRARSPGSVPTESPRTSRTRRRELTGVCARLTLPGL